MQKYKIVLIVLFAALVGLITANLLITPKTYHALKPRLEPANVSPKAFLGPGPVMGPVRSPVMSIVLDDWGNNAPLLKKVLAINRPITIAVLPHQAHSSQIAEEACAGGLGVILHMPMQPKNQKVGLEPHLITVETSDADIIQLTDMALASVGACTEGVNNHMGSAATSDKRVMRTLLSHLKQKNLFFFDSFVISTSAGPDVAREVGVSFAKRDIFIDNKVEVEAIKDKLREAKKMALVHGHVIVIGHDKEPTIEAIHQMVPELEKEGIRLVALRTLVKK